MHALWLGSKGTKNSVIFWSMVTSESAWITWALLRNGNKPESNTQITCRLAFSHVFPIRDQRLRGLARVRLCFSLQKFMHLVALGIGFEERCLTINQTTMIASWVLSSVPIVVFTAALLCGLLFNYWELLRQLLGLLNHSLSQSAFLTVYTPLKRCVGVQVGTKNIAEFPGQVYHWSSFEMLQLDSK